MSDNPITVRATVSYRRWIVPNFATIDMPSLPRQEGFAHLPTTPVAELGRDALDALAEAWITELYEKANRRPPQFAYPPEDIPNVQ